MKNLHTYLEGLLNKSNKTKTIDGRDILADVLASDYELLRSNWDKDPAPTWDIKIDGDIAYITAQTGDSWMSSHADVRIGDATLKVLKSAHINALVARKFTFGAYDYKQTTTHTLKDLAIYSTEKFSRVSPFTFNGKWNLENVIFKSQGSRFETGYFGIGGGRSLIPGKNVKFEESVVNIGYLGPDGTLGYDYTGITTFKTHIPEKNKLSSQILDWLEQKKAETANDKDLEKLIGQIPTSISRYEYEIDQNSTWKIRMFIYDKYLPIQLSQIGRKMKKWEWNGHLIVAYRQRGHAGQIFDFTTDPEITVRWQSKSRRK